MTCVEMPIKLFYCAERQFNVDSVSKINSHASLKFARFFIVMIHDRQCITNTTICLESLRSRSTVIVGGERSYSPIIELTETSRCIGVVKVLPLFS